MTREREIATLREELLSGAYALGSYRFFEIREPKRRLIAAAPFRDRVVHHALCNVIAPVLMRRFIARSFSCQIDKGTMAARECCRKLANRYQYVLKCDVSKFFPNIDHRILFEMLSGEVTDEAVLGLIWKILCSYRSGPEVPVRLFPDERSRRSCRETSRTSDRKSDKPIVGQLLP
jgi:RNA-directed DNA polymerase